MEIFRFFVRGTSGSRLHTKVLSDRRSATPDYLDCIGMQTFKDPV